MNYTAPEKEMRCPQCGHAVRRVRRRFGDRLLSMVYPVYRYRCDSVDCHWEGNLRQPRRPLRFKSSG